MTAAPGSEQPEPTPDPPRNGLVGLVLRGGAWQATAQLVPLAVNIGLTPVIISHFGVDRYGLYLLVSVINVVLAQVDGGIGGAALRFFSVHVGQSDRAATTRLLTTAATMVSAVSLVAFGAFYALARPVLHLFDIPRDLLPEGAFLLRTLVIISAVNVVRALFVAVLSAHQRFALPSLTMNLGHAIYVVGVLLTVTHGWGLYGIAWTLAAQQVVATLLLVPAACRLLDRHSVGFTTRAERREFLRYALHVQWSNIMLLVTLASDSLVIGASLPVRQVAYYATGANFALQMQNVPMNALPPIETLLGRALGERGEDSARREFEYLQRLWVMGATGWGVVAMAAAWFGVTAWLGASFQQSGSVAVIMLGGYLVTLWGSVLNLWTQICGAPQLNARSATVAAVVNLALTIALVMPFGIIGTVTATAVSQVVAMVMLLRSARRRLSGPTRSFFADVPVAPSIAAAAVVVATEWLARPLVPAGPLGLLMSGVLAAPGLAVYAAAAFGPRTAWRFASSRWNALRGRTQPV